MVVPSRLMMITILVVAVGAFMYVATTPTGTSPARTPAAAAASSASASPASPGSPTSSRASASAKPRTASPSASASPRTTTRPSTASKPSVGASVGASAGASPSTTVSKSPAAARSTVRRNAVFVEVFNNTKRKGLANRTARRASSAGWKVVGSDNWYGSIPSSTVYYPRQMGRAAKLLARDLGIARIERAVAPMRTDRLTVILTSSFRLR